MEFRWVAVITLWTFLIGPIIGAPSGAGSPPAARKPAVTKTTSRTHHGPQARR
jgi:hypothetical protein